MNVILLADMGGFLGRFHPLVVHLPIGFLLLAMILEWVERKKPVAERSRLIQLGWLLGAASAVIAALLGLFLANSGTYPDQPLFWHRWLGIALTVGSVGAWYLKRKPEALAGRTNTFVNVGVLALLFLAGHQGGNLTHGSDYLWANAPSFIQKLVGVKAVDEEGFPQYHSPDSTQVYADLIYPILERKCIQCHNEEVQRGGLNMSSPEHLTEGGDGGEVVLAGKPQDSEVFKRVTLPQSSAKYMPPKGEPMTYDEVTLLKWWLQQEAVFEGSVSDVEVPEDIKLILLKRHGLDTEPKPWYVVAEASAADPSAVAKLEELGFRITPLAQTSNLLDVTYVGGEPLTPAHLSALTGIQEQLTWLSLGGKEVQDDWLKSLGNFPNLTRLRLERNPITDAGIEHLKSLPHLESLNLYATQVTDAGLASLKNIPTLKNVYLWQTSVSRDAVAQLTSDLPDLEVDLGIAEEVGQASEEGEE